MSIEEIIQSWKRSRAISPCITDLRIFKKGEGRYRPCPNFIHSLLREALEREGIERLYSHQAEAIEAVQEGKDVVVVTPTASGKTLCYNLPVLNSKLNMPLSKAFYLFPTKALSQDQMFELQNLIQRIGKPVSTFTYDGDTPSDARQAIRTRGDIVITNPDMLHTGILPHHTKWVTFFQNLKSVVTGTQSPDKTSFFNTPPVVNKELGIRGSHIKAARRLASPFIEQGIQTILFTTSRLQVEILTKYLKDRFEKKLQDKGKVRGYRGGSLPEVRREIEKGLR